MVPAINFLTDILCSFSNTFNLRIVDCFFKSLWLIPLLGFPSAFSECSGITVPPDCCLFSSLRLPYEFSCLPDLLLNIVTLYLNPYQSICCDTKLNLNKFLITGVNFAEWLWLLMHISYTVISHKNIGLNFRNYTQRIKCCIIRTSKLCKQKNSEAVTFTVILF